MLRILVAIAVAALVVFLIRQLVKRVLILEYERGVLYQAGKFKAVLGPGAYWYFAGRSTVQKLDLRPRFASITGQEVLSADNVSLKISIAANYEIVDPLQVVQRSQNYEQALHLELQLILRELVGAAKIDDVLAQRQTLNEQLTERAAPRVETLGLRLLGASVKDIMFPGDLKRMFAQVVKAQKEGQAALEKARGESAALRNLANAAKLLENNPALLQLRLLQAVNDSGNTVVLSLPGQTTVLPLPTNTAERRAEDAPQQDPT